MHSRSSGGTADGIAWVKRENGIDRFDLVLIDGSEFAAAADLDEVCGAGYILLDDAFKRRGRVPPAASSNVRALPPMAVTSFWLFCVRTSAPFVPLVVLV